MDTVRCTVTCGHHWAGRQSELCQDFTPTEPAWRRRTRRGRAEEGAAWVPSPAPGGTGQRALAPGVTRQASLLPLGRGIRVPGWQGPGVHRFPAMGCFPPGHGSGPQVSRSQAVGQKPWTSACWAPRGQSGRRPTPRAGSEFAAVPVWGARPTADIWAGRWGRQGRACTPGVGVGHGGALCVRRLQAGLGPPLGSGRWNVIRPVGRPQHNHALYSSHSPHVWAAGSTPRSWFPSL